MYKYNKYDNFIKYMFAVNIRLVSNTDVIMAVLSYYANVISKCLIRHVGREQKSFLRYLPRCISSN